MQLPKRFYGTCEPCGGSSTPTSCAPPALCNDAYATLDKAPQVLLLGLAPGTICQIKLTAESKGFVVSLGANMGHTVQQTPNWAITEGGVNVATGVPDPFDWIIGAVGSGDSEVWRQIPPPKSGSYRLEVEGGRYKFVPSGSGGAASDGACSAETKAEVALFGCWLNPATNQPEIKKLNIAKDRVIVGYEDPDGLRLARSLPDASPLLHPSARLDTFQCATFRQTDPTSPTQAPYANGLPSFEDESADATLLDLAYYNKTSKKFFRAPAPVKHGVSTNAVAAVAATASYVSIGSGHLLAADQDFKFPDLFVAFNLQMNTPDRISFGVFVGGTLRHEWTYQNASSSYAAPALFGGQVLLEGLPLGVHTVEIKVKGNSGAMSVEYSNLTIFTVR